MDHSNGKQVKIKKIKIIVVVVVVRQIVIGHVWLGRANKEELLFLKIFLIKEIRNTTKHFEDHFPKGQALKEHGAHGSKKNYLPIYT